MFNFELLMGGNISSALVFHYSGKGHLQPWHFADLSINAMLDWLRFNPRSSNKLYEIAFLEWRQAYDELLQVVSSSWALREVQVLMELNLLLKENLVRIRKDIIEQDRKRVEAEEAKSCEKNVWVLAGVEMDQIQALRGRRGWSRWSSRQTFPEWAVYIFRVNRPRLSSRACIDLAKILWTSIGVPSRKSKMTRGVKA